MLIVGAFILIYSNINLKPIFNTKNVFFNLTYTLCILLSVGTGF